MKNAGSATAKARAPPMTVKAVGSSRMLRPMQIPTVAGTKYTGPNMYEFKRIVDLCEGGWTLFSGMDEQCLYAAMSGAPGNIGSTLNLMPGAYREIRASYEAGDIARAQQVQFRANAVTSVLHAYGFSGALREALRRERAALGPMTPPERRAGLVMLGAMKYGMPGQGLPNMAAVQKLANAYADAALAMATAASRIMRKRAQWIFMSSRFLRA